MKPWLSHTMPEPSGCSPSTALVPDGTAVTEATQPVHDATALSAASAAALAAAGGVQRRLCIVRAALTAATCCSTTRLPGCAAGE
jgi:hypothetical protein